MHNILVAIYTKSIGHERWCIDDLRPSIWRRGPQESVLTEFDDFVTDPWGRGSMTHTQQAWERDGFTHRETVMPHDYLSAAAALMSQALTRPAPERQALAERLRDDLYGCFWPDWAYQRWQPVIDTSGNDDLDRLADLVNAMFIRPPSPPPSSSDG